MSVKDINIKNHTYYFLMILSISTILILIILEWMKSFIYYIEYVMIKMDLKIYSVNSLYLIFGNVTGYFERINGNNYLTLVPSNENKEKLKKYHEL